MCNEDTALNYALWTALLDCGKRVWACAGSDRHIFAMATALTSVYLADLSSAKIIERLRVGDFVCGSVEFVCVSGIVVWAGFTPLKISGLLVAAENFHSSIKKEDYTYRLNLINEDGVV